MDLKDSIELIPCVHLKNFYTSYIYIYNFDFESDTINCYKLFANINFHYVRIILLYFIYSVKI